MKIKKILPVMLLCCLPFGAMAEEADHAIHEELRAVLRQVVVAFNSGNYDDMLPVLDEKIAATSITQEVMSNRAEVSAYFKEWFGPQGYMKKVNMAMDADALTELSPDKSWGLVRGKALEHYEAKDGDQFDFKTRWTAVMVKNADNRWRLRAIHFGTNQLDNPVLTKVQSKLTQYAIWGSIASLIVGLGLGWLLGRRQRA
jgi:ketosteroid isomerase-like protein